MTEKELPIRVDVRDQRGAGGGAVGDPQLLAMRSVIGGE